MTCKERKLQILFHLFGYLNISYTFAFCYIVKMKRQRIYIDTSIAGGFFDVAFEKETKMVIKLSKLETQKN
jgi:hypothetical protein